MTQTPWSIRILRPLRYEILPDGTVRLHDPRREEWVRTRGWTAPILDTLAGGGSGPDALAAAAKAPDPPSATRAKRFLLSLEKVGYVRVEVPFPASFGPWRVEGELGHGGVGIAYAASREGTRAVAKRPWDFLARMESATGAIRNEADVLARLDHPGIVRRLDLVEHEGFPVLVRERLDGPTLVERFEGAPATSAEARRIATSVGEILEHAHARGLLLVDYKPANFFLDERTARLRLVDAGHMRPPGEAGVGGTPGFMPPELERGGPASVASDVWGLGRLYAFLRTGALPARRSNTESPLDGVPDDARPFVARACDPDAASRPPTLGAALALLP